MRVRGFTPLCHFVTSPPEGGSLVFSLSSFRASNPTVETRTTPLVISPLEGEMPDRAEGGKASARLIVSKTSTQEAFHAPRL